MSKGMTRDILQRIYDDNEAKGWKPIVDDRGTTEHRGRRFPVAGCPCLPCYNAGCAMVAS
jgi:hypothetical protein